MYFVAKATPILMEGTYALYERIKMQFNCLTSYMYVFRLLSGEYVALDAFECI